MSTPRRAPRSRSAFAAAFLSLLFPGLGHAYAGAYARALGFAALPLLALALGAGIVLRADRYQLLGFVIQDSVLTAVFVLNVVALLYRVAAAVDAWQVARFLNAVDVSGDGRLGRSRVPVTPLSVAGLLGVLLVMAGGHVVVARYDTLALGFVNCVFTDGSDPSCDLPSASPSPAGSGDAQPSDSAGDVPSPTDAAPTPIGTAGSGAPAPSLPPWDGKERLNILLIGSDQRPGDSSFNTDTLIVVSVDPASKQVAMFQLPRDSVGVPVPANARSVWGSVYQGKINSWLTQNRGRGDLWQGSSSTTRGFNALKAILGELYGIKIPYYVMVNFAGFEHAVDTLGGVQINVQIPVTDDHYPGDDGTQRVYIPAGPQQMSGKDALVYARSRHGSNDFDRGRRQQRVLLSLRDQVNPQAVLANLPALIDALKRSVKTDIPTSLIGPLLSLSQQVDTKDLRSFVFAPPYFSTDMYGPSHGTNSNIVINTSRIRRAVASAFTLDPKLLAQQERLAAEQARVWVLNGSGQAGLSSNVAGYLEYAGLDASAPNQRPATIATTKIVVYNGAEADMSDTITYLEGLFKVTVTTATDPAVTVDMIVTLGRNAPHLDAPGVG
jgi:LCP family protein required for cell wall assembly